MNRIRWGSLAALTMLGAFSSIAGASILVNETFDSGTEGSNTNPGSPLPSESAPGSVNVIDPAFSPPDGTQNFAEVATTSDGFNAFPSGSIDLNTVGLDFPFTVSATEPLVSFSFQFSAAPGDGNAYGVLYEVVNSLGVNLTPGSGGTGPSTTATSTAGTIMTFATAAPLTLAPGTYHLQLASSNFQGYDGTQIDNVAVSATPEPATVSLVGIGAALLGLSRRRRS